MPHAHVNGVDLHYLQEGEGDDVLLLCGLGDDVSAWDAQVTPFAERYRVTVIDNRGVGRSSLPDGAFDIKDMAADAIALCGELGIANAHVMGFSMGGAITQELALARPDLARSLVIVGSWTYSDQLFRNFIESSIYFAGLADDEEKFLRYFLGTTYSHNVWEDGRIDAFAAAFLEHPYPQDLEAFQRTARAILDHDTRDRLGAITAPTLVLYGEEDIICPPRHSHQLASLIPGAQLVGVPEQAHQPFQEGPENFNRIVLDFWAQH
ncbi:MAG: alpha/beta fold hydrolase [Thermoleophilia bacterium]